MKIKDLFEEKHYEQCLVWPTEEAAAKAKEAIAKREGADLQVDWNVMYFPDKFTFDHVNYHYRMKVDPQGRPLIKKVSDLTDKDLHKTA